MKKEVLIQKVKELFKRDDERLESHIRKAMASGAIDLEGTAGDSYVIPKMVLSAIHKIMAEEWEPLSGSKSWIKDRDNLCLFL